MQEDIALTVITKESTAEFSNIPRCFLPNSMFSCRTFHVFAIAGIVPPFGACAVLVSSSEELGIVSIALAPRWRKVPPSRDYQQAEDGVCQREDPEGSLVEDDAL